MEGVIRTRKLTFAEILDYSVEVFKSGTARFIPLALLSAIPQALVLYLIQSDVFMPDVSTDFLPLCALCGLELVLVLFTWFFYIAEAYTVEAIVQGQPGDTTSTLRFALSRLPQVMLVAIVLAIIFSVAFILLIIPGVIVAIYFNFAIAAASLRGVDLQALSYSQKLVQGQWWRVFGILFGIGLLSGITAGLIYWLGNLLVPTIGIVALPVYFIGSFVAFFLGIPAIVFFLNEDYLAHPPSAISELLKANS